MKYVDESALDSIRALPCCLCHGRPVDAHHIFTKGAGQVDIVEVLVPLCRECHTHHHYSGEPATAVLLQKASERTGVPADDILRAVWAIRRLPKGSDEKAAAILQALRQKLRGDSQGQPGGCVPIPPSRDSPEHRQRGLPDDKGGYQWQEF